MNDKLFGDIGRKIKVLAIVSFYVLTILSIVLGIILIAANDGLEDGWWALFIIFFGPIVALILCWILYGFGELVENTQAIRSFPVSGINNNLQLLVDPIISESQENTEMESKETVKQEAEEIAKQEAEEIAKQEAEELTKEETLSQRIACELCDKQSDQLTYCKIIDDMGTRYRNICDECIQKHNAKPQ